MKPLFFAIAALLMAFGAQAADTQSSELPPAVRSFAGNGISIQKSMPAPDGFKGYVGLFRGQKIPVYLLPDGKHVVIGKIYGPYGNDLTEDAFRKASAPVLGEQQWQALADATWIAQGASDPDRIVYEFTDTECPYCHRLWEMTEPMLADSKTQVRHVIVAVISATKSAPRAAAILSADDPTAALQKHQDNFGHSPFAADGQVPADIAKELKANATLMTELGIFGTPGVVYRDADGKIRVQSGVPRGADMLDQIYLGE